MRHRIRVLACVVTVAATAVALEAFAAKKKDAEKSAPEAAAPAASTPARAGMMGGMPAGFTLPGVPTWTPPAQYAVDMVMTSGKEGVSMHRAFNGGSIRSEIEAQGQKMVMIERADEPGTTYTLMPSEKRAIKMNPTEMTGRAGDALKKQMAEASKPEPEVVPTIEKLGTETVDGHAAVKFKVTAEEHSALAWFDAASGAPLKMESGESRIEWKNLEVKPQPAKLFEVPKDYELFDMAEQMKQIEKMGGSASMLRAAMGGAGGVPGGAGLGGVPGMGGGLEGIAGGYGQQFGSNFGQQIGSGIGASFGGPIGAMAGSYIGGKVGGWIGRRVATAVTPDVGPGSGK
jgi:hypothetical protein